MFQRVDEEKSETAELLLIEVETGRRISLGPDKKGARHDLAVAFDDEAVVYNRRDSGSEQLIFVRRELADGKETRFTLIDGPDTERSVQVAIRSDLKGVFYSVEPEDDSEKSVVLEHIFESGEKRKIAESKRRVRLYSGPQPSWLAITDYSFSQPYDVRLVDVEGEAPVEKWRSSLPEFSSIVCKGWSPDGRHLMFSVVQKNLLKKIKDWPTHLWTVKTDDGSVQQTSFSWRVVSHLGVAPDGEEIVYQAFREQVSEVWRLDHLLTESSN